MNSQKKRVIVTKNQSHRLLAMTALIVYLIVSLWTITTYSLSEIGVVLFVPGLVILSIVLYCTLSWRIIADNEGLQAIFPFAKKRTYKWNDLKEVYFSYSFTNHEVLTLLFLNGKRIVVPGKCKNANSLRGIIITHKSIRVV